MRAWLGICTMCIALSIVGCKGVETITPLATYEKVPSTVAMVPKDGNSNEVNTLIIKSLSKHGLKFKYSLPAGTTRSTDSDLLLWYEDVWNWDMIMYLRKINITIADAKDGTLLAIGEYNNDSMFHEYPYENEVIDSLLSQMMRRILKNK